MKNVICLLIGYERNSCNNGFIDKNFRNLKTDGTPGKLTFAAGVDV